MKKTLIPNDLRDFLSILSFVGFIAIFLKFALNNPILSNVMDSIFLLIAGAGLMVIGKVFHIVKWAKDGIQSNEVTQLMSIIFGMASIVIGVMMLFNMGIPTSLRGFVGFLALVPALFIFFDYITKNSAYRF